MKVYKFPDIVDMLAQWVNSIHQHIFLSLKPGLEASKLNVHVLHTMYILVCCLNLFLHSFAYTHLNINACNYALVISVGIIMIVC